MTQGQPLSDASLASIGYPPAARWLPVYQGMCGLVAGWKGKYGR